MLRFYVNQDGWERGDQTGQGSLGACGAQGSRPRGARGRGGSGTGTAEDARRATPAAVLAARSIGQPRPRPGPLRPAGPQLPSRLPRRRRHYLTSCRRVHVGGSACARGPLLPVSLVTSVRGPGSRLQLRRRYGSPGFLSLAQPQVPVHRCQLRGREGEEAPGGRHASAWSPGASRPRSLGPAARPGGAVRGPALRSPRQPRPAGRGRGRGHWRSDSGSWGWLRRGEGRAAELAEGCSSPARRFPGGRPRPRLCFFPARTVWVSEAAPRPSGSARLAS